MTYNIYDGAPKTLQEIIQVVNSEIPDYLVLNEANTFAADDNKILKDFASKTNFPYFEIALCGDGDDYHVAVLSKYPFKKLEKVTPLDRACITTVIDTELGELVISGFHLTPYTEARRIPEIKLIIDSQKQYANKVLVGDMNSLSSADGYNDNLVDTFSERQLEKFTESGKLKFDVIDEINLNGYKDSAVRMERNREITVPTPINKYIENSYNMRLDYIFLSDSLVAHLKSYAVVKNSTTDKASDHYPVVVELS